MSSQSRLSKSVRSIGRSIGSMSRHKYTSNNNFANLTVNNVRDIKPNDIKFKNIHIERLPKQIRPTIIKLQSLKQRGVGHISHGKSLRSINKYNRTVRKYETMNPTKLSLILENGSRTNHSRGLENRVPTLAELQQRRRKLNGPTATLQELQQRRSKLNGPTATLQELQQRRRNLNKVENI